MPNYPIAVSKETLLALLDDMRHHIEANDSFEGSIEYLFPEIGDPPDKDFRVRAAYRIGNSGGQGGMRIIGSLEPQLPSQEEVQAAMDGDRPGPTE